MKNKNASRVQDQLWLSRRFLAYKVLSNMWFVGAIWLYFYRLFITDSQVGILDGMAFAVGLVAEVPSGVLADKFGRDKLVKLGQLLAGLGYLIQAVGSSFLPFVVGQAVVMIGISFVSGADEALFFDKLQYKHSVDWRRLMTRASQIVLLVSTMTYVVGAGMYAINPRLPWISVGLSFIGSVFLIWPIQEHRPPAKKQKIWPEITEHVSHIVAGFREFGAKKLFLYVPIIVILEGLFYAYGWGLLRLILLDRFHFSPFIGSLVVSGSSLVTVGIMSLMHKFADQLSEKRTIITIALFAAVSLLLSVSNIGMWGFFVIFALHAGEHIFQPFMSEILNYHTSEQQRATVLSVASFLRTIPYIFLAPIIGYLNSQSKLEYFLITWTILIAGAVWYYVSNNIRDAQITFSDEEDVTEQKIPEL